MPVFWHRTRRFGFSRKSFEESTRSARRHPAERFPIAGWHLFLFNRSGELVTALLRAARPPPLRNDHGGLRFPHRRAGHKNLSSSSTALLVTYSPRGGTLVPDVPSKL